MTFDRDTLAAALLAGQPQVPASDGRTRAAVAMILREREGGLEVLLIQRAAHDKDPWSGHLAFPGGKIEAGEDGRSAAERETREEVGIPLDRSAYLGPLGEIIGMTLPVRVCGHVYLLDDQAGEPVLNDEVYALFWVPFHDLMARERHILTTVHFDGGAHQVPAIRLSRVDTPVLWGLTYRMVMNFMKICGFMGPEDGPCTV